MRRSPTSLHVPRDLDEHDHRVRELNAHLRRWLRDDDRELKQQLALIDVQVRQAMGGGDAGARLQMRENAKNLRKQRFRDQANSAEGELERIGIAERMPHKIWRALRRRPLPKLEAVPEAQVTLDAWDAEENRQQIAAGTRPMVDPVSME